jgi:hypothetical protein
MRRTMFFAVTALLALFATSSVANAQEPQQTVEAKLTPTKLDKKKYKPAKIFVDVETGPNDEDPTLQQPPSAERTIVDFPKNMKFDTTAVDNCKVTNTAISNTTGDQAKQLCGPDSQVGSGVAEVRIGTSPTTSSPIPIVVTAFNGNQKDQIYLHSDPTGIPTKPVLVGKLVKGPTGFGRSLDVTIPPLGAGAISNFETTVKAGKYVQTRCKQTTNPFRARSFYTDHSPTTTPVWETKCKRKKKK